VGLAKALLRSRHAVIMFQSGFKGENAVLDPADLVKYGLTALRVGRDSRWGQTIQSQFRGLLPGRLSTLLARCIP
jgi:hypothetical protein